MTTLRLHADGTAESASSAAARVAHVGDAELFDA